jgi:hypothetical protein
MIGRFLAVVLAGSLSLPIVAAHAQDMSKYPDFEGQWRRGQGVGAWDPTKPPGKGQQAPLTPQAQAVFEGNIKKIAEGKVYDPKWNCGPPGMPRMMMVYQPMEIVIKPKVSYFLLETEGPIRPHVACHPGRKDDPGYNGYSVGPWHD